MRSTAEIVVTMLLVRVNRIAHVDDSQKAIFPAFPQRGALHWR
jgi:hypothetical protein